MQRVVIMDYLFYYHILFLTENEAVNRYIETRILLLPFESCEKKKYLMCEKSLLPLSILVKIMHLSQFFFHMLTLKTVT